MTPREDAFQWLAEFAPDEVRETLEAEIERAEAERESIARDHTLVVYRAQRAEQRAAALESERDADRSAAENLGNALRTVREERDQLRYELAPLKPSKEEEIEDDRILAEIRAMTPEERDEELRKMGIDPEESFRQCKAIVKLAIKNNEAAEEIGRLREELDTAIEDGQAYEERIAALEQDRDRLKATVADCGKLREDIKYGRRHHGIRLDEIDRKLGDIIARAAIADEPADTDTDTDSETPADLWAAGRYVDAVELAKMIHDIRSSLVNTKGDPVDVTSEEIKAAIIEQLKAAAGAEYDPALDKVKTGFVCPDCEIDPALCVVCGKAIDTDREVKS